MLSAAPDGGLARHGTTVALFLALLLALAVFACALFAQRGAVRPPFVSVVGAHDTSAQESASVQEGVQEGIWWEDVPLAAAGRIQVPGTPIDCPVVQAGTGDPDYYLTHDASGAWDPSGVPYLDAACTPGSLGVVVFGHNMSPLPGAASVFGPLVSYSDPAFMAEHLVVLFSQRGGRTLELRVVATEVCAGTAARKGAGFKTRAALMAWYEGRMAQAQTVAQDVPDTDGISQVFTFVTCSYGSKDERTLVYAVAVRESEVPVGSAHIRPGPTEPLASLRLPEPRTGLECY